MSRFISSAIQALRLEGAPCSPGELVDSALKHGMLKTSSRAPQNTMRARLSEHINTLGASSEIHRVAPNRFALREWGRKEYFSTPFTKQLPNETLACLPASLLDEIGPFEIGLIPTPDAVKELLSSSDNLALVPRWEAEATTQYRQLVSYVLIQDNADRYIVYQRGKYSTAHPSLLKGNLSIGFGGHIQDLDVFDLFSSGDLGARRAAVREVSEELKGSRIHSIQDIGIIWDNTSSEGLKHLGIVLESRLSNSDSIDEFKTELSINGIKSYSIKDLINNINQFEFWSQLAIRHIALGGELSGSSIRPTCRPRHSQHVLLVGEIASGKTTLAKDLSYMSNNHTYVSARSCLLDILEVKDFNTRDRTAFQEMALDFIDQQDGPRLLAQALVDKGQGDYMIMDGIRNVATLRHLREMLPDLAVLYVDCPRDQALYRYMRRANRKVREQEFIRAREHPTEAELPLLRQQADAILFNSGSPEDSCSLLADWLANDD